MLFLKTLDLLYKMTNPMNVVTITDKLIQHLRQTQDQYLRTELVSRITQLAERYYLLLYPGSFYIYQ